jgi:hypothetical protein
MSTRRDSLSRLIVAAQVTIGLVVLLGLVAFLSLNPYLITIYAFTQVFLIFGVALFVIALITSRRVLVEKQAPDQAAADTDSGDRVYVLKSGQLQGRQRRFR